MRCRRERAIENRAGIESCGEVAGIREDLEVKWVM